MSSELEMMNRAKNVIEGPYFKRFGSGNVYCKCRIDVGINDDKLMVGTFVCHYCEWANCSECECIGFNIVCTICK